MATMLDASVCSSSLCLSVLKKVFEQKESAALRSIAYSKDKRGRTLLHIMHKDVADYFKKRIYFRGRYEICGSQPIHCSATSVVYQALDHGIESEYEDIFFSFASVDETYDRTTNRYSSSTPSDLAYSLDISHHFSPEAGRSFGDDSRKKFRTASFDVKSTDSGSAGLILHYDTFRSALKRCISSFDTSTQQDSLEDEEALFDNHALDGTMSLDQWLSFSKRYFGAGTRSVAIKFMQEKDQFEREIQKRRADPSNAHSESMLEPYVLGIVQHFDRQSISNNERIILNELQLPNDGNVLQDYPYGIIMPAADRNLDTIYRSERPDLAHIKVMMQEVGEALHHCHEHGIIHGDLKMLNVVRVQGKMRLIDLDAAAVIDEEVCGAKFSSGILPPEMFCRLENKGENAIKAYDQVRQLTKKLFLYSFNNSSLF
jgi:serine/threonine protein kinase